MTTIVDELRLAGCVFAEDEAALLVEAAADQAELRLLVAERVAGRPLEYVLGWAEFAGIRVHVTDGVFVPRLRTVLLLQTALETVASVAAPRILELCCGSAALATAFERERPDAIVLASDLDPRAVECARLNLGDPGRAFVGDLYDAVPSEHAGLFDVIVANAPYVPTGEIAFMPQEARLHEAAIALDGGPDGTALQARVAEGASRWLAPGGTLVVETSVRQADATCALFERAGLVPRILRDDSLDATAVAGVSVEEG